MYQSIINALPKHDTLFVNSILPSTNVFFPLPTPKGLRLGELPEQSEGSNYNSNTASILQLKHMQRVFTKNLAILVVERQQWLTSLNTTSLARGNSCPSHPSIHLLQPARSDFLPTATGLASGKLGSKRPASFAHVGWLQSDTARKMQSDTSYDTDAKDNY